MSNQLERCIATAKAVGCPKDQVNALISKGYIPLPWQWAFHAAAREADKPDGPVDIGLGGARGPGKSHAVLSQAALDDCQRIDGLKVLFLRQTGVAAKESFEDLVTKVCVGRVAFQQTGHTLRFKNGSRILLGGFKDEKDIDKYVGVEYDIIIIEELNQLTDGKYAKLRGSLRTSKPNWRPRMYTSFNPGGLGHSFVKERYIIPFRKQEETTTRFIGSTYKSNPYLNPEYILYLEELGGDLGKAWREGEWDIFAGQYFSEFRYSKHVVDPFELPDTWHRFRAIDPSGRSGTTSCHWYAVDQDGTVWIYKEHYKSGMDYDEHATEIKEMSMVDKELEIEEEYDYTIIDTSAFAKAGYSETGAEIYERHGVTNLIPAAKERVIGWNAVHHYLRWKDNKTGEEFEPKLKIFSTCTEMIRTIPLAIHDETRPEDVASVWDGPEHGDALDELRYFLRSLRDRKAPKAENPLEKRLREFQERTSGNNNFNYTRS